ncbi:MAG: alpha/beta hydrolase [Actinomadura sp.]
MRKVLLLGAVVAACASATTFSTVGAAAARHDPIGTADDTADSAADDATDDAADGAAGGSGALGGQVGTAEAFIVTLPRLRTATYSYGASGDQRLDAYWRAPEAGTQPGILLLHGGYWFEGDKASWRAIARRLADRGYAVFAADYRLSEAAPWPAQRTDAATALAFVKRFAGQFGLDPERVVVVGSSAGGQLAAMLGTYGTGGKRVRGVVALSPVNSPYLGYIDGGLPDANGAERKLRKAVVRLIGCAPEDGVGLCWTRMDDVAPATYASSGDAPLLVLHSTGEFVPPAHSTELVSVLKSFGVAATLAEFPGDAHGTGILNEPQGWRAVVTWIDSITKKAT